MIINKERRANNFTLLATITTTNEAHGKCDDHWSEVEQIINANLDALKVKLDEYLNSIPNKTL